MIHLLKQTFLQIEEEKRHVGPKRSRADRTQKELEIEKYRADSLMSLLTQVSAVSDSLRQELEHQLLTLFQDRMDEFMDKVYRLDFMSAEKSLKEAAKLGVKEKELFEGYAELAFIFMETGNERQFNSLLETLASLVPNFVPFDAQLPRHFFHQLIDDPTYEHIYNRYYPTMQWIEGNRKVNSFFMARTETTVWQYFLYTQATDSSLMKRPPWGYKGDYPMVDLTWSEATAYANWLSQKKGLNFQLPTERQWYYAARGGRKSKNYPFAGSKDIDQVAWYKENAGLHPHPVAQKAPNSLGLYDMTGNVWEYCRQELFNAIQNPHILRGGSWTEAKINCHINRQAIALLNGVQSEEGFRLVQVGAK